MVIPWRQNMLFVRSGVMGSGVTMSHLSWANFGIVAGLTVLATGMARSRDRARLS